MVRVLESIIVSAIAASADLVSVVLKPFPELGYWKCVKQGVSSFLAKRLSLRSLVRCCLVSSKQKDIDAELTGKRDLETCKAALRPTTDGSEYQRL